MKLSFSSADVVCRSLKDVHVASHCVLAGVVGRRSSYGDCKLVKKTSLLASHLQRHPFCGAHKPELVSACASYRKVNCAIAPF